MGSRSIFLYRRAVRVGDGVLLLVAVSEGDLVVEMLGVGVLVEEGERVSSVTPTETRSPTASRTTSRTPTGTPTSSASFGSIPQENSTELVIAIVVIAVIGIGFVLFVLCMCGILVFLLVYRGSSRNQGRAQQYQSIPQMPDASFKLQPAYNTYSYPKTSAVSKLL